MRLVSYVLLIAVVAVMLLFVTLIILAVVQTKIPVGDPSKKVTVTKRSQLRYLAEELAEAHLQADKNAAKDGVRELEELGPFLKERDFAYFRKKYSSYISRMNQQNIMVEQEVDDLKYLFRRQEAVAEARRELKD